MMVNKFKTIEGKHVIDFKEKGSKFIGMAAKCSSTEEVNQQLLKWKENHPKASHLCYAYKIGVKSHDICANDDGEPNNSAGMSILGQIESFELSNTLVGVIRYYGGKKLGVGGLMQAYKNAAKMVIEANEIVDEEVRQKVRVFFTAEQIPFVMNELKGLKLTYENTKFDIDCTLDIALPLSKQAMFFERIRKYRTITYEILV